MLTWSLLLAAISAGFIGGLHCIGMCGGIAQFLLRLQTGREAKSFATTTATGARVIPILAEQTKNDLVPLIYLHLGRLSTYTIIGAIFGVAGDLVIGINNPEVHRWLYLFGNLWLLILAMRLFGIQLNFPVIAPRLSSKLSAVLGPSLKRSARHPYLTGVAWGTLPCGLSFLVAPFAMLSGAAWSGAILMLSFGLAALPHLLLTQMASSHWRQSTEFRSLRWIIAGAMMSVAILGLFYWDMRSMPDFLCVSPNSGL